MKQELEAIWMEVERGALTKDALEALRQRTKVALKDNPALGSELGVYLARLSKLIKNVAATPTMHWQPILNGALCIGHKPGGKLSYSGMRQAGTTLVLTLLQESEGGSAIGQQVRSAGMDWLWLPFSASKPEATSKVAVFKLFAELQARLQEGAQIYIHCSAGIHRTGMITYALLRYSGLAEAAALSTLTALRAVTAAQVGNERLEWSEQFA